MVHFNNSYLTAEKIVWTLGVLGGPGAVLYQFVPKEILTELYMDTVGADLNKIIEALHDPFMREISKGQRIGMLVIGWFLVLFAFEVVIRSVLFIVTTILRLLGHRKV